MDKIKAMTIGELKLVDEIKQDSKEELKMNSVIKVDKDTQLLNPIKQIPHLFKFDGYEGKDFRLGHIEYDESLDNDYDYQIIRSSSHDGTLIFTMQTIAEVLEPLVNRSTYCKKDLTEDQLKNVLEIDYTVGNIKIRKEYGKVTVPAGKISGLTETVSIPVRCKYTFKQ